MFYRTARQKQLQSRSATENTGTTTGHLSVASTIDTRQSDFAATLHSQTVPVAENLPACTEKISVVSIYLASLAPGSRRTIRQSLAVLADILTSGVQNENQFDWHRLDPARIERLRTELAARFAPATANKMLSARRGTLRTCRALGLLSETDCRAATAVRNLAVRPALRLISGQSQVA